MSEKVKAEIGIFPALLRPAQAVARRLGAGEQAELDEYGGFFVARPSDVPKGTAEVFRFVNDDEEFVIFESSNGVK